VAIATKLYANSTVTLSLAEVPVEANHFPSLATALTSLVPGAQVSLKKMRGFGTYVEVIAR
jgi:hypothetical protein